MSRPLYLVTGGCGFIGSHLADALMISGAEVRILDDLSTGRRENVEGPAEIVVGDVADTAALRRALDGVSGCFHLAAIASVQRCNQDWAGAHRVNLSATVSLFELAKPDALDLPVVYASSAAVYGAGAELPLSETTRPAPLSAYGADKLGCELHASAGAEVHGLRSTGLRFFNVYGPRQDPRSPYSGVISIFSDRISVGQPITILGDGDQSRDFIYVGDVVALAMQAMRRLHDAPDGGRAEVYNACTGVSTSIRDLARVIGDVVRGRPEIEYAAPREGDIRHSLGNPEKAAAALGIRPGVPLSEGLSKVLPDTTVPP